MKEKIGIKVKGHLKIVDDLGNVLVDKDNAIHPQNLARAIARAFANEKNFSIYRMAFGNGGTIINVANQITFNPPNVTGGWNDRLYNETYSEIVDDSDLAVNTGPNANPGAGSISNSVVSTEPGVFSEVTITVELNANEPTTQIGSDSDPLVEWTEGEFTFDEIGLFTSGVPHAGLNGYQDVSFATTVTENSVTGLAVSTGYSFQVSVDGQPNALISLVTPATGTGTNPSDILYRDILPLINAQLSVLVPSAVMTLGADTGNNLRTSSNTTGPSSSILITDVDFVSSLSNTPILGAGVVGQSSLQNGTPTAYADEGERMLTHVIFAPVAKTANRTLLISYTISLSAAQAP